MPRSGAWMGNLRSGLGFALLATVVWLLWIVGRGAGSDASLALLAVLLAGAFIAWSYGRLQLAGARFAGVGAGLAVLVLVAGGANLVGVAAAAHGEPESESAPVAARRGLERFGGDERAALRGGPRSSCSPRTGA